VYIETTSQEIPAFPQTKEKAVIFPLEAGVPPDHNNGYFPIQKDCPDHVIAPEFYYIAMNTLAAGIIQKDSVQLCNGIRFFWELGEVYKIWIKQNRSIDALNLYYSLRDSRYPFEGALFWFQSDLKDYFSSDKLPCSLLSIVASPENVKNDPAADTWLTLNQMMSNKKLQDFLADTFKPFTGIKTDDHFGFSNPFTKLIYSSSITTETFSDIETVLTDNDLADPNQFEAVAMGKIPIEIFKEILALPPLPKSFDSQFDYKPHQAIIERQSHHNDIQYEIAKYLLKGTDMTAKKDWCDLLGWGRTTLYDYEKNHL